MKKHALYPLIVIVILMGWLVPLVGPAVSTEALSGSSWQAGRIIDDGIFYNGNDMSVAQVQAFLNNEVPTCDTWGTQTSEYGGGTRAQYGTAHGYPPPYICLKNYYENPTTHANNLSTGTIPDGSLSAAQIVVNAAQTYGISVRALLVTLQKESAGPLLTDTWPFPSQYTNAMGYGCPDTAPCDPSYAGFYNQMTNAARQFALYKSSPSNYRYQAEQNNTILYSPNAACGSSTVYIQNYATAGLYDYTPYQPDQAALNNLYGTGDSCSAYGNRNFWRYFNDLFGSTTYNQPPSSLLVVGNQSGRVYFVSLDNNTRYFVPTWTTLQAYGLDRYQVMPMDDSEIDTYTDGGTLTTLVWDSDTSKIYLVDGVKKYWMQQYCLDCSNANVGDVTFLTSTYFENYVADGGLDEPIQQSNGVYYLMQNGTKEPFASIADLKAAGYNTSQVITIQQSDINSAQPIGNLLISTPTFIQFSPSPNLYYYDGQTYHYVPSYATYQAWGNSVILQPPTSLYNTTPPAQANNLSVWTQDGSGHYYLINNSTKIDISSNPANWYGGTFQTMTAASLDSLNTTSSQPNVSIAGNIFTVGSGTIHHVPTYDDYLWLGINPSNTLVLGSAAGSAMTVGTDALRDGAPFTVLGNGGLYVRNNTGSYHIPTSAMVSDFGIDWSAIRTNLSPADLSAGYPSAGDLTRWVHPGGTGLGYVENQTLLTISSTAASNWGIDLTTHPASDADLALLYNVPKTQALGNFLRDETTGQEYYASGGAYHLISTYSTFVALGGTQTPIINVYPDFFTGLTQGSSYN
jgi:hypothetical protein